MAQIRLNKLLSQAGAASRRLADELIAQHRVEVNGRVVSELGTRANPDADDIRVDGRRLRFDTERRYILLNKPRGVLSTRTDPHQRRTVIDLLAAAGVRGYFYPVGRLDYESEGLILLTNDGEFAERVTHPRYELERTYEAIVEGVPDDRDIARLRNGVMVEGRRTLPAEVELLRATEGRKGPQAVLQLTLREGRNRQVRHMCAAIGHPVDRLRRTRIGSLADSRLETGRMRDLLPHEIRALTGGPPLRPSSAADRPQSKSSRPPMQTPARRGRSAAPRGDGAARSTKAGARQDVRARSDAPKGAMRRDTRTQRDASKGSRRSSSRPASHTGRPRRRR